MEYKFRDYIGVCIPNIFESMFIEIVNKKDRNVIVGVICWPNMDLIFSPAKMEVIMDMTHCGHNKNFLFLGEMNVS